MLFYINSFTFHFSFSQKYQWDPLPFGVICNDSSGGGLSNCHIEIMLNDTFNNLLWVGGVFDSVQGVNKGNIAAWNGNNFITHSFSGQFPVTSNDWIMYNDNFVGCSDNGLAISDIPTGQNLGHWNSSGTVNCLAVYNGDLIAAGKFSSIDGVAARSIARWDGTAWHPLGNGITGAIYIVYSMKIYNGKLYVGGAFDKAGTVDAWNIACWDGTNWSQVGGKGTDFYGGNHNAAAIFAMEVFQGKLYVSGRFDYMNNILTHLAYWDGTTWTGTNYPFGSAADETRCMKAGDSLLYLTAWGAGGGHLFMGWTKLCRSRFEL